MSIRLRLALAFVLLNGLGFYFLVDWLLEDIRPRYLEAMEETLVDSAHVLAALVSRHMEREHLDVEAFRNAFTDAARRRFTAKIYQVVKTRTDVRVYITDRDGVVVFDSDGGKAEGQDYSQWNDVYLTLRGQYGARSTRNDPDDPRSSVLYVAAPVTRDGEVAGVLTIAKPARSVRRFIDMTKRKIVVAGLIACGAVVLLGVAVSLWITHPLRQLTRHAEAVRDGKRPSPPRFGRNEIGALAAAFEQMRDALEGKQYVERYVQALTHEMKSPLAGLRGAAELLGEHMPEEERQRFVRNIQGDTARLQALVDRMLRLAAVENRKELRDVETIDGPALLQEISDALAPLAAGKGIALRLDAHTGAQAAGHVRGERFLLRQALDNLVRNAIDFSPREGEIVLGLHRDGSEWVFSVRDQGPGVPAYAADKVFERFYSLPRPDTGKKSSGLGLPFVREAALLHGGRATLDTLPDGGALATLVLPDRPGNAGHTQSAS